jgi:hypothetical protein
MIYLIVIPLCVLMAVGLYYGITSSGMLGESSSQPYQSSPSRRSTSSGVFPRVPHARELPQGCLIALIVAAIIWFLAWGVILFIALNFLRSPA